MLLFERRGYANYTTEKDPLRVADTKSLLRSAEELLRRRGNARAADHLARVPFELRPASNDSEYDASTVLFAVLRLAEYERVRGAPKDDFQVIADVLGELKQHICRVEIEMALVPPSGEPAPTRSLSERQINKVVYKYIGVNGGYLGDFVRRTHFEFYVDLDLDINPYKYEGTTKERFIAILRSQSPATQARILEGVLKRFPPKDDEHKALAADLEGWIVGLRSVEQVVLPDLEVTSEVVERALNDADNLIRSSGATSGVDRVHTALHGYLKKLCVDASIAFSQDAEAPALLALLRKHHPAFARTGPRPEDTLAVLNAFAVVVGKLSPMRNRHSVAHPNEDLLDEPEAMLAINATRSILRYLDEKVSRAKEVITTTTPAADDDYASFDDDIPF